MLQISGITEAEIMHAFIWGLKDHFKAEVRLCDPADYWAAIKCALDVEEQLRESSGRQYYDVSVPRRPYSNAHNGRRHSNPNHAAASSSNQGPVPMDLDAANMQPRNANANANRGNRTRDMSQVKCFACG